MSLADLTKDKVWFIFGANMESDFIRISDRKTTERHGATLLMTTRDVSDEVLLEAMIALGEGDSVSLPDGINSVVAKKVLHLGIPKGSQVVFPTTGIICRNMHDIEHGTEPLVAFRERLWEARDAMGVMKAGFELGDRATHFAAGFVGNRNLQRVMKDEGTYARAMANLGYRSAFACAESREDLTLARTIAAVVPDIIRHFSHIVKVLASFVPEEIDHLKATYS